MFRGLFATKLPSIQGPEMSRSLAPVVRHVVIKRQQSRMFKGGATDRLQESWNPFGGNIDNFCRIGLRKMRNRSREQFCNNEYAKKFYALLKANVVGHVGIKLQSKALDLAGRLDTVGNAKVEKAWRKWCKKGNCDVTGKLSFVRLLHLALETVARDGEIFIRKVRNFDNGFRFALQLIDPDMCDMDYNTILPNGNVVRMGVEFNSWDAPVAYWFLKHNPYDVYSTGSYHGGYGWERVPADEIIHLFCPEFVRQSRGFPWGHAAMARLRKIDRYEEAEISAAYGAAAKMGFYEIDPNAEPDEPEYDGDEAADEEELLAEFDPFTIEKLPPGYKFKPWDPQHPAGNYDPFMARMLRATASGFLMSYHSFANDRSDANYGSQRGGTLEDRDLFKVFQEWLVSDLLEPLFPDWFPFSVLTGNCNVSPLDMSRFLDDDSQSWKPRRWDWIDPLKDVTAKIKEKDAGLTTATAIITEKGGDPEELYQDKKQELQLEQTYGVKLGVESKGGSLVTQA